MKLVLMLAIYSLVAGGGVEAVELRERDWTACVNACRGSPACANLPGHVGNLMAAMCLACQAGCAYIWGRTNWKRDGDHVDEREVVKRSTIDDESHAGIQWPEYIYIDESLGWSEYQKSQAANQSMYLDVPEGQPTYFTNGLVAANNTVKGLSARAVDTRYEVLKVTDIVRPTQQVTGSGNEPGLRRRSQLIKRDKWCDLGVSGRDGWATSWRTNFQNNECVVWRNIDSLGIGGCSNVYLTAWQSEACNGGKGSINIDCGTAFVACRTNSQRSSWRAYDGCHSSYGTCDGF